MDYREGKLPSELATGISEHLNSCEECMNYYKLILAFNRAIEAEKELQVNPFLFTRIEEKLKASGENKVYSLRTAMLRTYSYYAAVIIIALFIGVFAGTRLSSMMNTKSAPVVVASENEQLKQDFYLNEIEKDDVSQLLNNQ